MSGFGGGGVAAGRALPPGVGLWDRFLSECRRRLPVVCPHCGAGVVADDPSCEESFDAHHWYEATFFCDGLDDDDDGCLWSVTFEALVSRDRQYGGSVDWNPCCERVEL